ncbi:unnamed protein product [Medioppia subpectinata]|uniref:Chromo domain-containing protein n=1 Tax=Medioppia subpectinata TaxID=1979941 RepID=A0A7R9KU48_9ACAR|nr:unnamed protein product [Medioppia subpectinata]CAG2109552.1 unnamed protein product [Medioppia subpectinata]
MSEAIDDNNFKVEKILKSRQRNGRIEYFVKWHDFPDSGNTWEPIDHLIDGCHHLIRQFERIDTTAITHTTHTTHSTDTTHTTPQDKSDGQTPAGAPIILLSDSDSLSDTSDTISSLEPHDNTVVDPIDPVVNAVPEKGAKEYRVFPSHLIPKEIIGAAHDGQHIWFFMTWINSTEESVVLGSEANTHCPQLVIQFYEKRAFFQ